MGLKRFLGNIDNFTVSDAITKADSVINHSGYSAISCSVSGGADSDVMMDIVHKLDEARNVRYYFVNTGIEYQATKDHIQYLRDKYDLHDYKFKEIKPKPIPLVVKDVGQPFISKMVSSNIKTLQKHNFNFVDSDYNSLVDKYPKCTSALKWWCNKASHRRYNIEYNKWLKEFMIENKPWFSISDDCCIYVKKHPFVSIHSDLMITGLRQSEGGARGVYIKSCFSHNKRWDNYRPLFWFSNSDRLYYENKFNIVHSKCYTEYGFVRTGCACCPFGIDFEKELDIIKVFEPNIYTAVNNIFYDSYEYTRMYRRFRESK